MKIDVNEINNVVQKLHKSVEYSSNLEKTIRKYDIPEDFKYAVYIRKMPQNMENIDKNIKNVENWTKNVVEKFKKAEGKNNGLINDINTSINSFVNDVANRLLTFKKETKKSEIFNQNNKSTFQYGGNQMVFKDNNKELVQDPMIQSIIKRYWPNATEEDMELLLLNLSKTGCGYTAMINTVFEEYAGEEELFEKTFGFPMYTKDENGKIDYNYEYLILEYFCYIWGNGDNPWDIEEIYGKNNEPLSNGTNSYIEHSFSKFMEERYGIKVNISTTEISKQDPKITEKYKKSESTNEHIVLSANDFILYPTDGGKTQYCDGHSITIIGTAENGNLIVTSWGREYELKLSDVKGSGYFHSIQYER